MQAIGMLTCAAAAGWLISHLGPQMVLVGMSVMPLAVVLAASQVDESYIHEPHNDDSCHKEVQLAVHLPSTPPGKAAHVASECAVSCHFIKR